jgi:polyvinyl alcohol dehydrogenase (cytochrome)
VLAFDLKTGALRWAHQLTPTDLFGCVAGEINCADRPGPDFDFGASPALATAPGGRDLIVIGQKSAWHTHSIQPEKASRCGAIAPARAAGLGGIQWGTAVDGTLAYFPVSDIYSAAPGGLHAVKLSTGERVWHTPPPPPVCGKPSRACSGAQFSAVTVIPGVVFSPSNDGAVRAYSTTDGAIVWTFDTNREFTTVNGCACTRWIDVRSGAGRSPAAWCT